MSLSPEERVHIFVYSAISVSVRTSLKIAKSTPELRLRPDNRFEPTHLAWTADTIRFVRIAFYLLTQNVADRFLLGITSGLT